MVLHRKCLVLSKWQIFFPRVDSKQAVFPANNSFKNVNNSCILNWPNNTIARENANTSHSVEDMDCKPSHNHNQHSVNQVGGKQNALAVDKGLGFKKSLYYIHKQRIRFRNTGSEARNVRCSSDMATWTPQKRTHHRIAPSFHYKINYELLSLQQVGGVLLHMSFCCGNKS